MRVIKRYENHKHYHAGSGVYVSMREIGNIAAGGDTLRVVVDRTGEDVTLEALARSLYDHLRDRDHSRAVPFPDSDLVRLIKLVKKGSK